MRDWEFSYGARVEASKFETFGACRVSGRCESRNQRRRSVNRSTIDYRRRQTISHQQRQQQRELHYTEVTNSYTVTLAAGVEIATATYE